jgi:hypothetical protein
MAGVYLDRAAWGANTGLPRLGRVVPRAQFTALVCHHTVIAFKGDVGAYMRALQTARPDLGLDVPYSFVVFNGPGEFDYTVAEGRGFDRTGAHTQGGYNSTAYGCALAGDYTNVAPTIGQLIGIRWIGAQLVDPYGARPTIGHRDVHSTACPGALAYPLLDRLQPPFVNPPIEVLPDLEQLMESETMFQLIGSAGLVRVFVPGQRSVELGGLGDVHVALNKPDVAPVAGTIPQDQLETFAARWDASVA